MDNLVGTSNAGFEIVQQGEQAVLGFNPTKGEFVAWNYSVHDGQVSYYWGRYGNELYASDCFHKKENNIYSGEL